MSDQQVPQAPNYSPMINAFNGISSTAAQNGQDALTWAKGQVANNQNLADHVTKGMIDTQGTFGDAAKKGLGTSQGNIDNATSDLYAQRDKYRDPARVASDMGASEANVGQSFDAARNASTQELESYGVNPGATRFGALDIGTRTQEAAAKAAAGTTASRQDEALGNQSNAAILQQGNTGVTQAQGSAATSGAAGTGAAGVATNQTASGNSSLGTGLAWTGANTNALTGAVGATNTGFNNQAEADKIANSSSSGVGSLLGMGASMLGKGGALASGGALAFLSEGGAIPDSASPSGGAATDDVPAQSPGGRIQVNAGEFVIPKDVAQWEGQKSLQQLILKARKAMQDGNQAPAQPRPGPAVGGPNPADPAFQPRPAQPMNRAPAVG